MNNLLGAQIFRHVLDLKDNLLLIYRSAPPAEASARVCSIQ